MLFIRCPADRTRFLFHFSVQNRVLGLPRRPSPASCRSFAPSVRGALLRVVRFCASIVARRLRAFVASLFAIVRRALAVLVSLLRRTPCCARLPPIVAFPLAILVWRSRPAEESQVPMLGKLFFKKNLEEDFLFVL